MLDHPVCNVMDLEIVLVFIHTQDQIVVLLVYVVKEKLWCPAFLTAFVKVSNTSNEYFQNSPFFITLLLGLSYNNCILTKIEKKTLFFKKTISTVILKLCITKYISNNFWSDCNCHPNGSTSQQCDEHGICICVEGATGDKCNGTSIGFVPILPPIRM